MLIINNRILTLLDQELNEVTKALSELLPELSCSDEWIFSRLLVELLSHGSNDVRMFHICLHVPSDSAFAAGGADEKLHQTQQSGITIGLEN